MGKRLARFSFALVVLLAVGASVFRVATAPDRIQERRNTARTVCLRDGGEWVVVERDEICRHTNPQKKA